LRFMVRAFLSNYMTVFVQVWPKGKTVFPDFFLPQTADVWEELITKHFETIRFDGLWIVSARLPYFVTQLLNADLLGKYLELRLLAGSV